MYWSPIDYDPPVYRPPSEAGSLLLQLTIGCSHNKCTYCNMYRSKTYHVRPLDDIFADLEKASAFHANYGKAPLKVFLCDGDALGAPMDVLVPVLDKTVELFPKTRRIGVYATAQNILDKTRDELVRLAEKKLSIAYLGIESGSDDILKMVVKGNTAKDMEEASLKIKECGWQLSVIIMLGLGGREFTDRHRRDTAKLISTIVPDFFSFLTTVPVPGTPYMTMLERKKIEPLTTLELLEEMRDILAQIDYGKGKTIFRANHVSNQFPLAGTLPKDTEKLVKTLENWISQCPEGVYPEADPRML